MPAFDALHPSSLHSARTGSFSFPCFSDLILLKRPAPWGILCQGEKGGGFFFAFFLFFLLKKSCFPDPSLEVIGPKELSSLWSDGGLDGGGWPAAGGMLQRVRDQSCG